MPISYTYAKTHAVCPWQAYHRFAAKDVAEPVSAALAEGNQVHTELEYSLKHGTPPIRYKGYVQALRGLPVQVEHRIGLQRDFATPCGWWDADVYVRASLDVLLVAAPLALVLDWKTGRPREDPLQLTLYGTATFAQWPAVQEIHVANVWLKERRLGDVKVMRREHLFAYIYALRAAWAPVERSLETGDWPAKPGRMCEWCPVGADKCQFGKPV